MVCPIWKIIIIIKILKTKEVSLLLFGRKFQSQQPSIHLFKKAPTSWGFSWGSHVFPPWSSQIHHVNRRFQCFPFQPSFSQTALPPDISWVSGTLAMGIHLFLSTASPQGLSACRGKWEGELRVRLVVQIPVVPLARCNLVTPASHTPS